jgi:ketosteroid isomerase-like protein
MPALRLPTFRLLALVAVLMLTLPGAASAQSSDSTAVAETVHAYHTALQTGDSAAVLALLADDVFIAESGGMETREEYVSHHLPGDMAFASGIARTSEFVSVTVEGDVAWTMSTSRTEGMFRDREINSRGAETMVLRRTGSGWRITAIHWSSRQVR